MEALGTCRVGSDPGTLLLVTWTGQPVQLCKLTTLPTRGPSNAYPIVWLQEVHKAVQVKPGAAHTAVNTEWVSPLQPSTGG